MMFKTHLLFGFLVGLFALSFFNVGNKYLFLFFVLLGALMPDIDETRSKIGQEIKIVSRVINFAFGHRGFMHTVYVPLIVFLVFLAFGQMMWGFGFLVGYLSHIFIDGLTLAGVEMFHPLSKMKMRGFIRTGGFWEYVVFVVLFAILIKVLV